MHCMSRQSRTRCTCPPSSPAPFAVHDCRTPVVEYSPSPQSGGRCTCIPSPRLSLPDAWRPSSTIAFRTEKHRLSLVSVYEPMLSCAFGARSSTKVRHLPVVMLSTSEKCSSGLTSERRAKVPEGRSTLGRGRGCDGKSVAFIVGCCTGM